jgi:Mg2+ and Co2+ transporter CorA
MSTSKHLTTHDSHETRIALLEQSIGHIAQTLLRIEARMDKIDLRIDKMETSLNLRIDKLENRLWQILFLLSSSIVGLILGKIFHWI